MSATGRSIARHGSTLIEVLCVVAILGLIGGLAFPRIERLHSGLELRLATANLAADLRAARAEAIRTDAATSLSIAGDGRSYRWTGGERALAERLRLSPAGAVVSFTRRGSASAAALTLASPDAARVIAIDAIGGTVAVRGVYGR